MFYSLQEKKQSGKLDKNIKPIKNSFLKNVFFIYTFAAAQNLSTINYLHLFEFRA